MMVNDAITNQLCFVGEGIFVVVVGVCVCVCVCVCLLIKCVSMARQKL